MDARLTDFIKQHVLVHFDLNWLELGDSLQLSPLGKGHINQTFLVQWPQGAMVLQRINTHVFSCPKSLMDNLHRVYQCLMGSHLDKQDPLTRYQLAIPRPLMTNKHQSMLDLGEQGVWRGMEYLESSHCIEQVDTSAQAETAARAFAHFSRHLMAIEPDKMQDVIPDFHDLSQRIKSLTQTVKEDPRQRLEGCQHWVDFAVNQTNFIEEVNHTLSLLPRRICHNDTKINNLLFKMHDMTAMAVIDLDTCMSGYLLYDFGDMVRTFCSTVEEDSHKLEQLGVRETIFAAICKGYLSELGDVISLAEKQSLWLGARLMCFMLGVRFLIDHLAGDHYFKIQYPGHNLVRAANQFTLYQRLLEQEADLVAYIY
ncbi:phosphotransferase enzyme family protein [Shewanella surugensis]|uniref:Aminoglycoside phosphotransferase family protein n=1 Tax=Shewanella surugensis TaxID=212020 RepID=A0ABT0LA94_9GAMM|nr:aminoglycoside phosphotransferase family protein [Shewanella surugensis]MCL1124638.1 aminoglycoside phosphotransferase family protein [Shewanella surugensis]